MDFVNRSTAIQEALHTHDADVFLLLNNEYSGQPGTRYLSGFNGSTSALIIGPSDAHLITDGRYATQAKNEADECEQILVGNHGYLAHVADILIQLGAGRVLVDSARTSFAAVLRLKELLPNAEVKSAQNILQEIRQVKSENEIACIRVAVEIAGRAFARLLPTLIPGVTEQAVAAHIEQLMKEEGAERIAFDTIVASGKNGALPHARPTDKPLAGGEFVTIDFGVMFAGYASDITRTIAIGEPPAKLWDIYEAVLEAQTKGIHAVRSGISGAALDAVCRSSLRDNGYGEHFVHSTGHGVGMEVHELPIVGEHSTSILASGMVITVEPGVYIAGLGGVRIEDDIAVRRTDNLNLTGKIERTLFVLPSA